MNGSPYIVGCAVAVALASTAPADWLADPVREWNIGFSIGESLALGDAVYFIDREADRLFRFVPTTGALRSTALIGRPGTTAGPALINDRIYVPLTDSDAIQVLDKETLETKEVLHIGFAPLSLAADFAPAYDPARFLAVDGSSTVIRVRQLSLADGSTVGGLPDTRLDRDVVIGVVGGRLLGIERGFTGESAGLIAYQKNALRNIVRTGEWFAGRDNEVDFEMLDEKVFLASRNRHDLRVRDLTPDPDAESLWPMGGTSVVAVAVGGGHVWAATGDESSGHITQFAPDGTEKGTRYVTGVFSAGLVAGRVLDRSLHLAGSVPVFTKRSGSIDRLCWIGGRAGVDPLLTVPTQDVINLGGSRNVFVGSAFRLNPDETEWTSAAHKWTATLATAEFMPSNQAKNPEIVLPVAGKTTIKVVRTARHSKFFSTTSEDSVLITAVPSGFTAAMIAADLGATAFQEDPDGDGLANLMEYALGRDPRDPDEPPAIEWISHVAADGPHPAIRFRRRTGDPLLSVGVSCSRDCDDWRPVGSHPFATLGPPLVRPLGDGLEEVTMILSTSFLQADSLFARLSADYAL